MRALPTSRSTVRVRYAETDKMGVVYYANYFVWFEVGRADLLRSLGWTYREMEHAGVALPVIGAEFGAGRGGASLPYTATMLGFALGGVLISALPSSRDVLLVGGVGGTLIGLIGLAWFAALPADARAPKVVHLPETGPVERSIVVVRDITPQEGAVEPEVLRSAEPSA